MKTFFSLAVCFVIIFSQRAEAGWQDGVDAGTYSTTRNQVQTKGTAEFMTVLATRQVRIEVAQQPSQSNYAGYAATGVGAALGGLAGSSMSAGNGRTAATLVGGLVGGFAGQAVAQVMSQPTTREVVGTEITLINKDNEVIVISQTGNESFIRNESVMVIQAGSRWRVTHAPTNM